MTTSQPRFDELPFRAKLDALYEASALEKRDLILASPDAFRLLRAFEPESLFHTIQDVGVGDCLELLALASGEQLCGLIDLDCWRKDRIQTRSMVTWLEAIAAGGQEALGEFLASVDLELLLLLLKQTIVVHRTDDPEDPIETDGAEEFELDQHYRIYFPYQDTNTSLVRGLLTEIYERDYGYFVTLMEQLGWNTLSELEEESFKRRNSRLQDRGFADYYEALEIFRPLHARDFFDRLDSLPRGPVGDTSPLAPDRALVLIGQEGSFFSTAMRQGFPPEAEQTLREELAFLSSRVLVVEGADHADEESVRSALALMHDTVNLALESLSGADLERAAEVLATKHIQHLFRYGWGLQLELRRMARRALDELGLGDEALFLDSPHRETLTGLLDPRPRYFRGLDTPGEIDYRRAASLADLARLRRVLEEVRSITPLCRTLLEQGPSELASLRPEGADDFRLSAVITTATAQLLLGREASARPITLAELGDLRGAAVKGEARVPDSVRSELFARSPEGIPFWEHCLGRLEEELLALPPQETPDPRFLTCLMLAEE